MSSNTDQIPEVTEGMQIDGFDKRAARLFVLKYRSAGPDELTMALLVTAITRNPRYFESWPDRALNFKLELGAWVRKVYYGT